MRLIVAASVLLASLMATARAAPPDVHVLVREMKTALEPPRPSVRKLTFRVSNESGEASQVMVGQARGTVESHRRILNLVLAPESLRGMAYLVQDGDTARDVQWLYLPVIGRVRTVVSPEAYSAFLNSDFTYADLGFVSTGARYKFLDTETHDGTRAFKIEGVPKQTWYYGRTVTWIDADSRFPIERQIYDAANQLWKVERWEQRSVVDGVPTALRVSMEDVQSKVRTDIDVSAVRYDVALPEGLLEPAQLPKAAASPLWNQLGD
jgi:outer membrane lipoprotein-sorting protein